MDILKGINSLADDFKAIGHSDQVDEAGNVIIDKNLVEFLIKKPHTLHCRNLDLDPTPDEYLFNKFYNQSNPSGCFDYGKAIAIYSDQSFSHLIEIYSPPASIGICQLNTNGNFVLVFKNKVKIKGFALPGGTLDKVNPNCGQLSPVDRAVVYGQALDREFLEECGIKITQTRLLSVEHPLARLKHSCAVYLCKGYFAQQQREEDKDHIIIEVSFDEMFSLLTGELAIDGFLVPLLTSQYKFIYNYFH